MPYCTTLICPRRFISIKSALHDIISQESSSAGSISTFLQILESICSIIISLSSPRFRYFAMIEDISYELSP